MIRFVDAMEKLTAMRVRQNAMELQDTKKGHAHNSAEALNKLRN